MLEAIDIVLICLGTALSVLVLLALSLLLVIRWRNSRKLPQNTTRRRYPDGSAPFNNNSLKSESNADVIKSSPSTNVSKKIFVNEAIQTDTKPLEEIVNSSTNTLVSSVNSQTHDDDHECRPAVHSIKRPHRSCRPCKIKLTPDLAKAAQVEAVQTEHHVDSFMEDLRRIRSGDNSVLYEEFQILEVWDLTRERSCCAAEKARTRNRFADILPNDDSRVILRGPDDYINASLIDGYCNSGQFIATQGPIGPEEIRDGKKENTVNDFWRMIWEKNVQCILMLTDCIENMRISQFHFLNWSDTRGPNSTEQLLDFIDRIAHKQFHKPIVVHCSAGVGRTGVLIALWRLIEQARQHKMFDIFGTVDALRRQRSRMVQTAEQYLFLYEAMSTVITDRRL